MYPQARMHGRKLKTTTSNIDTYGTTALMLNLKLRGKFPWEIIIANVLKPMTDAEFLYHYGVLVDQTTGLTSRGNLLRSSMYIQSESQSRG